MISLVWYWKPRKSVKKCNKSIECWCVVQLYSSYYAHKKNNIQWLIPLRWIAMWIWDQINAEFFLFIKYTLSILIPEISIITWRNKVRDKLESSVEKNARIRHNFWAELHRYTHFLDWSCKDNKHDANVYTLRIQDNIYVYQKY